MRRVDHHDSSAGDTRRSFTRISAISPLEMRTTRSAIPAMAATVAIPVAVAVVVRCMQLDDGGSTGDFSEAADVGRGASG